MLISKIVTPDAVYSRTDYGDGTTIDQLELPVLGASVEPEGPFRVGDVARVTLALQDFDGERRADNLEIRLLLEDAGIDRQLASGELTLTVTLAAAGTFVISAPQGQLFRFGGLQLEVTP